MEIISGLLVLLSLTGLALGLITVIRPIRRIGLGSRKRAGLALAASIVVFFFAVAITPPTPQAAPDATNLDAKSAQPRAVNATPVVDLDITRDELLRKVNAEWSDMDRQGAFVRASEDAIESGPWKGGKSYVDCSSRNVCITTTALRSGNIHSATSMATGDGSFASGVDALASHIALLRAFGGPGDHEAVSTIVLEGMEDADAAKGDQVHREALGHCLSWIRSEALGMTAFEISPLPCDPS